MFVGFQALNHTGVVEINVFFVLSFFLRTLDSVFSILLKILFTFISGMYFGFLWCLGFLVYKSS